VGPVTEQSEHLSNAQIENYGNRTSGAGPEAAQRDEHQRVNHQSTGDQSNDQSIDDQRVEAHLTDCPSCRNRVLDFHRSLFASPTFQPEPDRSKAGQPKYDALAHDSSLYGHLPSGYAPSGHLPLGQKLSDQRPADSSLEGAKPTDSALADSNFANSKYPAEPQVRTAPTPECPSDDALRQLAASLTPDDAAAKLTQHAATCDHCGPLLRTFTEDFSDDFSPEEQAVLDQLRSASPKWQKQTAREMLKRAIPSPPSPRPIFSWKWIMVPASAAVVAVSAFTIWFVVRDTPEKVETLLAQSYTEDRTMEMRIPYAKHSEFHQLRSGDSGSLLSLPESYRKAGDQITVQLKKNPDDPGWLLASAQFDLMHWDYLSALKTLNKIEDAKFKSSSQLLMIRALALYEQAEDRHQQEPYFESADLLGKVLLDSPNDPVALFNHAIVCERIELWQCAESDWNRLLTVETDRAWADEARERLTQIESKKKAAH
jgi:tetratricopeptide (TPR) repeat protein